MPILGEDRATGKRRRRQEEKQEAMDPGGARTTEASRGVLDVGTRARRSQAQEAGA